MRSGFVSFKSSRIHYLQTGNGRNVIVAFHGFGEPARTFGVLKNHIEEHHTLIAIDLPLHGDTSWNEGLELLPTDLITIINSIPEIGTNSISLAGFSMGGRVCLSLFELMPDRIEKLILLAPDGLIVNPLYRLATRSKWGNRFFYKTMKDPGWFMKFANFLKKAKLVNKSVHKFSTEFLKQPEARMALYRIWTLMNKFRPNLKKIKSLVKSRNTRIVLVFGQHDRIITPKLAKRLSIGIESQCELIILNSGHNILNERNAGELESIFNS
ncbi:MAG: hypothetical protein C5B52_16855 [Bacteroidetes bacterium]|nr:MAG: hypothetical protein C5B52_16855 [Bacteroidota bacterium]